MQAMCNYENSKAQELPYTYFEFSHLHIERFYAQLIITARIVWSFTCNGDIMWMTF